MIIAAPQPHRDALFSEIAITGGGVLLCGAASGDEWNPDATPMSVSTPALYRKPDGAVVAVSAYPFSDEDAADLMQYAEDYEAQNALPAGTFEFYDAMPPDWTEVAT